MEAINHVAARRPPLASREMSIQSNGPTGPAQSGPFLLLGARDASHHFRSEHGLPSVRGRRAHPHLPVRVIPRYPWHRLVVARGHGRDAAICRVPHRAHRHAGEPATAHRGALRASPRRARASPHSPTALVGAPEDGDALRARTLSRVRRTGIARRRSSSDELTLSRTAAMSLHPPSPHRNTPLWAALNAMVAELVSSREITVNTAPD